MGGEGLPDGVAQPAHVGHGQQGEGGTAETGARHAGADRPRGERRLHGLVQFGAGDLEVVPQRGVGGGQRRPDAGQVASPEPGDDVEHPGVLGDHVAGPAQPLLAQFAGGRLEVGQGGVPGAATPSTAAASCWQARRRSA